MTMEEKLKLVIRSTSKELFVNKEVDLQAPNIIASIVEAGGYMALASDTDICKKADAIQGLLEAYNSKGVPEVESLVESLNPNFVKANIGYAVDYMDFGAASAAYKAQKQSYDQLYNYINTLNKELEKSKTL